MMAACSAPSLTQHCFTCRETPAEVISSFKEWIITLELSFMNKGFQGNFAKAYTYGYCYNRCVFEVSTTISFVALGAYTHYLTFHRDNKNVHLYIVMERGSMTVREVVKARHEAGKVFSQKEVEEFELQIISQLSIIHSTSRQSHGDIKLDNFIVVGQDKSFGVQWTNKGTRKHAVKTKKERIVPIDQGSGESGLYPRFQTCDSLTTLAYAPPESIIGTVKTLSSVHNGADSYAFGLMILEYRLQKPISELLEDVKCPEAIQIYLTSLWKKPEYGHLAHFSKKDKKRLCDIFYWGMVLRGTKTVNADGNTVDDPYLKDMDDCYKTEFIKVIKDNTVCREEYTFDVNQYSILDGILILKDKTMAARIKETTKGKEEDKQQAGKLWIHRLMHPNPNKRSTVEEYGRGAYS
jgi:serine/threonine protein kinase